ncbi:MAG: hypothetical protein HY849_00190 [Nitrosomonadales bacterium]|nr:hypothetical protein [Nitrosomonadales bacterium]
MNDQLGIIKATILPAITGAISFLFGVPVAVLIAAFAGSWMAVAVSASTTFARSALAIFCGTVASGYLTPAALHFMGEMPQRPAAAILGFFAVHKPSRDWLIEKVKSWFKQ